MGVGRKESQVCNLCGGGGSSVWASLASLSLQTDAAGWEGCPPISWPTVPTTPEWGVISATLNTMAFGPYHRALAGLRTDLLSLGWGWQVRPGGGPATLPAGPKALSLHLEAEPNLGGLLEAGGKPPPLCGQPSSSSASAEDPEAGGAWGTALEKDHAVVSRPAPRPTAPAFP